ncbi:MAG: hypothetical protein ACRDBP_03850 [Luteolibacter sp.]
MKSHLSLEFVRDESGVSIYRKVSVRKKCEVCRGTGRIRPGSERVHTHFCNTRAIHHREASGIETLPKSYEKALGYFLLVALLSYAWIMLFKGYDSVALWPRIGIALAASIALVGVLRRFSVTPRLLRWCTLVLVLTMVCGGVAFEIVRG